MRWAPLLASLFLCAAPAGQGADFQRLAGHGGPVKGIAVAPGGSSVLTASFDYSVGLWAGGAPVWLEGHRAAANAVTYIDETRALSGGDDFALRLWDLAAGTSVELGQHKGKIISIALSPDRRLAATASWDGSIGLWPLDGGGAPAFLTGHDSSVNAVAFAAGGRELYSGSADGTLRLWRPGTDAPPQTLVTHGFGINTLVLAEDQGWLAYGAVDGGTRVLSLADGAELADLTAERRPILAMALNPAGTRLAVGDGEGFIMVVETAGWTIERDFRAAARGPVWALAFTADGESLLAGGLDDAVFSWPVDDLGAGGLMAAGERSFLRKPEEMSNGERQFQRKCSICHVLTGDTARRAGPTLEGIFGRRAGSVPGYGYSPALTGTDLVWTEETIDALFDIGPDHYLPGTKMPMQRIAGAQDRADLIAFLKAATRP